MDGHTYIGSMAPADAEQNRDIRALVMRVLPPAEGDAILDIGCGNGSLHDFLASRVPNLDFTSADIVPEARNS